MKIPSEEYMKYIHRWRQAVYGWSVLTFADYFR